uniref:beta-N-acetylhexosaminidase n=1 Tax=Sphaeramia orbicularis TaxID=375764 RepID=A0A673ATC9_9TELE
MESLPWPKGQKLVHLDLKGAPPRVEYLHKLIDLFSQLGVNGLLVEYEDMFPYEGELKLLQATTHSSYSREEVLSLQEAAKSKGMEVIPLIQTFGHMEFVLKHRTMCHLREVAHCVGTLNPHKEDGVKLVMEMLRQVVELHPDLHTLHIGADEVYMLGEGEESKLWLASPGQTVEQLFLIHVAKVAKAIKEAWPQMHIIMWDDMMRGMSQDTLNDSGLIRLVEPMLWDYTPNLDVEKTVSLLEKYCSAGMVDVWAASSFKGSTSVHTCVPNTHRHVENHRQWLKVAASVSATVKLKGIALTGWQRYDHLSVLCELIPVALPSLVTCLQLLTDGQFNADTQRKVTEKLGPILPCHIQFVRGWFSPYHQHRKMVSPLITMQIHRQASTYLTVLQQKVEAVREEMVHFYPDSTVQEWFEEHVSPVLIPLQRIRDDITVCLTGMESGH